MQDYRKFTSKHKNLFANELHYLCHACMLDMNGEQQCYHRVGKKEIHSQVPQGSSQELHHSWYSRQGVFQCLANKILSLKGVCVYCVRPIPCLPVFVRPNSLFKVLTTIHVHHNMCTELVGIKYKHTLHIHPAADYSTIVDMYSTHCSKS